MMRVAAAGAAAHTEQPEERGGAGEENGEPGEGEGVSAEADLDAVLVQEGFEGADEDGEEDGGG